MKGGRESGEEEIRVKEGGIEGERRGAGARAAPTAD